jgi:hypothetical protein
LTPVAARAFLAACLLYAAVLAVLVAVLPDRVPLHFGADLQADRAGSRAELLLAAAGAGVLLAALFAGLARWSHRMPLHAVNVPHAHHWKTPEHEAELRRRVRTDMLTVGAATLVFLAAMFALVGRAAVAGTGLSGWAVVLLAAFLTAVLGWSVWLATHRYRPPATGPR